MNDTEAEQVAWEWFAQAHPNAAHAIRPDRFWGFFHAKHPDISRAEMEALLKATERPNEPPTTPK